MLSVSAFSRPRFGNVVDKNDDTAEKIRFAVQHATKLYETWMLEVLLEHEAGRQRNGV